MENNGEQVHIKTEEDLKYLVHKYKYGEPMAFAFVFDNDELYTRFFAEIGINLDLFLENHYFYDPERNIHISESEFGYVWISTMGLVAKSKITGNKYVNACYGQKIVLTELLNKAITICANESVYDVDSYAYSEIEQLTPTLFHNSLFFFETVMKAYLSLCEKTVPFTHKLEDLLILLKQTMFEMGHNNTMFHAHVVPMIEELVNHINRIPGKFKEEYVKYDDNPQDITVILFDINHLNNMRNEVEFIHDIIFGLYYDINDQLYLRPNLYDRLLQKSETEEAKNRIRTTYGFLLSDG